MTVTTAPGGAAPGWLDRAATIAKPGFNRWLVPPAALAIHLCIGMSYGLSVFWLPLSKAIAGATPAECKDMTIWGSLFDDDLQLARQRPARNFHDRHRAARRLGGAVRRLAGARGAAQGGPRRRCLLGRRLPRLGARRLSAPALDDLVVPRLHRRHRARTRLHFAGLDARQMVPGSARHGDRHGDHGLRRRRDDRLAARQSC